MEKIRVLREEIDAIDTKILHLLKQRVEVCKNIGETKRGHGISIRDSKREDEQIAHLVKTAKMLDLDPQEVETVYREIIAMCVHAQEI